MPRLRPLLAALTLTLLASACTTAPPPSDATAGEPVVHASGQVWGSVARAVAGEHARVTVTDMGPNQDPHSYEPSAQDKLAFSKATVVLLNGGHYDEWAEELVASLEMDDTVLDAMTVAEEVLHADEDPGAEDPGAEDPGAEEGHEEHGHNEHVFQSIPTVTQVASELADRLAGQDATHAQAYRDNAAALGTTLEQLLGEGREATTASGGARVLATESVASLLVDDLGLTDVTPEEYLVQSETDDGPSVAVLARAQDLLRSGGVDLLLVNAQTGDEASSRLEQTAREAGVPVVGVHETLPEGVDTYDAYMRLHVDAIVEALG